MPPDTDPAAAPHRPATSQHGPADRPAVEAGPLDRIDEFDYCTACDEPLHTDRAYWTCEGEAFCDYCGSRLPRPQRHAPVGQQPVAAGNASAGTATIDDAQRGVHPDASPVAPDWAAAAAQRFRAWTRTEQGARVCLGVAQGRAGDENAIVDAFLDAISAGVGRCDGCERHTRTTFSPAHCANFCADCATHNQVPA